MQKPQGVMVWAAINGRGELIVRRCPPKVKARDYTNILNTALNFIKPRYGKFDVPRAMYTHLHLAGPLEPGSCKMEPVCTRPFGQQTG